MEFPKEDSFMDYEGKNRLFEYYVIPTTLPAGYIVRAEEKNKDGYRFESYAINDPSEVLGDIRRKIKEGLSVRYLHEKNGRLSFSHDKAQGYISHEGVVIDGQFVPFTQLCNMIQTYEGFRIEIKIKELGEE